MVVVAVFPLAKLGFLLLKQLSKPLANAIKNSAKHHPFFRKYVCIPPAQAYHWCEMQIKLHVRGRWKPVKIFPITEDEAVELGAHLIGEIVLFSLLSALLIAELNRQSDNKATKEKIKEDEILILVETVMSLISDVEELKEHIKTMKTPEKKQQAQVHSLEELEEIKSHLQTEGVLPITMWDPPVPERGLDPHSPSPSF